MKTERGFTLFELLVAITIAALAVGAVVSRMGRVLDWDLKSASTKLSSTIRYLYNKSVSEGVTLRLVIDFDANAYWVESTPDPYALVPETEETAPKPADKKPKKEIKKTEDKESKDAVAVEEEGPKKVIFGKSESYLLRQVKLPDGVFFKDVFAEHQIDRLSQGLAYLYFFPRGYAERAVIHLRDAKDNKNYSLTVNPISGAVKIEAKYAEPQWKE